jgi:hypothetical protein
LPKPDPLNEIALPGTPDAGVRVTFVCAA